MTHNPEIASYSTRTITLKDGKVTSDEYNANILDAAVALAAMPMENE